MFQVIDHITVSAARAEQYLEGLPEGLWVILAPKTQDALVPSTGQIVSLTKPDGSTAQVALGGAAIYHGVMGLHFRDLTEEDIPRLTRISW